MKKFIKSIVLTTAASSFLLTGAVMAADQKIAVVNFQEVMGKIPQTAIVMQALEEEFKDERNVITALEKDIQYNQEKLQRDGALMSAKDKTELEKKIGTLYQDYQVKGKALQQKAGKRQGEEQNKIIALVRQAVDNIATKGKYDMIVEQKSVVFVKPDLTITDEVVEQVSKLK